MNYGLSLVALTGFFALVLRLFIYLILFQLLFIICVYSFYRPVKQEVIGAQQTPSDSKVIANLNYDVKW